ncbi:hypothetical protein QJ854_gp640 [Moumouvirus goulette]|uniref:Uncharacterized protein n=1 Tax=Moumouvirus goulette TaxID=1247379 RepID=M1PWL1_9VIRU|nr:hypothetical protein QJ854_gp640 [Moumouvirus goulette]AGF85142.1 hypothetical protein glt_00333 [Moumouvirus goulette]
MSFCGGCGNCGQCSGGYGKYYNDGYNGGYNAAGCSDNFGACANNLTGKRRTVYYENEDCYNSQNATSFGNRQAAAANGWNGGCRNGGANGWNNSGWNNGGWGPVGGCGPIGGACGPVGGCGPIGGACGPIGGGGCGPGPWVGGGACYDGCGPDYKKPYNKGFRNYGTPSAKLCKGLGYKNKNNWH